MTEQSEQKVNHLANLLASKNLLTKHFIRYDQRVYYVADHSMPNFNRIMMDLVLTKFSPLQLQQYLQKTQEKALVLERRVEAVRQYRAKYRRSHRLSNSL
jgi:hypothetical protein